MSTMGERIKQARENKGLFQSQLANIIGVKSAGVISNWEKDLNKPDADKMVQLCKSLDISLSYLIDYHGKEEISLSINEQNHIKKYRSLTSDGKKAVDMILDLEVSRLKSEDIQKVKIAARGGKKEIEVTKEQTQKLKEISEKPNTDDYSDVF